MMFIKNLMIYLMNSQLKNPIIKTKKCDPESSKFIIYNHCTIYGYFILKLLLFNFYRCCTMKYCYCIFTFFYWTWELFTTTKAEKFPSPELRSVTFYTFLQLKRWKKTMQYFKEWFLFNESWWRVRPYLWLTTYESKHCFYLNN